MKHIIWYSINFKTLSAQEGDGLRLWKEGWPNCWDDTCLGLNLTGTVHSYTLTHARLSSLAQAHGPTRVRLRSPSPRCHIDKHTSAMGQSSGNNFRKTQHFWMLSGHNSLNSPKKEWKIQHTFLETINRYIFTSACNAGDLGLIPGLGRSPGEGKGYPLQYSGLENFMDCIVQGVTKELNMTEWLSLHFHLL